MKKVKNIFYIVIAILLCIPIISVNALTCNNKVLNVSDENFMCNGIDGDTLTFTLNDQDYSTYFSLNDKVITIDPNITFPSDIEIANIEVKDSSSSTTIKIKNNNYVTTTTTTKPLNIVVVTFDKNDGSELSEKKCSMIDGSDYCSVVLPKLNLENFNGWGTQKECKEGISGTVKVYEDIKYYACYKKENDNENGTLKIKSLDILDKKTLDKIDYGELIDNKYIYNIRVLYEVEGIFINAVADAQSVVISVEGNENLVVGENKVFIKLKDSNGNNTTYTLNVERLEEGEPLTKIHYLSSLVIGGSEINFNKEVFEYNVTIDNDIKQLEITKIPFYEDDMVTVRGNENLVNGSKIFIDISGEDENVTTYTINVFKEQNDNNTLMLILILLVILIVILVLIIFIKRNKKNNKEVRKTKEKIKKAKNKAKNIEPEVLINEPKNEDIEVLKF